MERHSPQQALSVVTEDGVLVVSMQDGVLVCNKARYSIRRVADGLSHRVAITLALEGRFFDFML